MVELNQGSLSIDDQKQREGEGIGWEISTFGRQFQSCTGILFIPDLRCRLAWISVCFRVTCRQQVPVGRGRTGGASSPHFSQVFLLFLLIIVW